MVSYLTQSLRFNIAIKCRRLSLKFGFVSRTTSLGLRQRIRLNSDDVAAMMISLAAEALQPATCNLQLSSCTRLSPPGSRAQAVLE